MCVSRRLLNLSIVLFAFFPPAIELATRVAFSHISALEHRVATEHARALSLRHGAGHPTVLFAGNSLLLTDVDMDQLRRLLPRQLQVERFVVEATYFIDWQFGVRRLFADGARPDYLVLVLAPANYAASAIRGDYSAYYLFSTSDIPLVGRELGLTRTAESSLYVARYSLFWAARSNTRSLILRRTFPEYTSVLHMLATSSAVAPHNPVSLNEARLRQLDDTARQYGCSLILLVPPGFDDTGEQALIQAAGRAGVKTLVPVRNGAWPATLFFGDRFHLTTAGAGLFTAQLAEYLSPILSSVGTDPAAGIAQSARQ